MSEPGPGAHPGRAREPDVSGFAERDGVRLAYDVYGDGPTTVLLMPTWSIVHSRVWKAQIGYLARHHRVVTFDGRGNGRSDRPAGAAAYSDAQFVADTVAVMDATGTTQAVLVGLSMGVTWSVQVAAEHPGRVLGVFAIASAVTFSSPAADARSTFPWQERLQTTEGWAKYNKYAWLEGHYDEFLGFFFGRMFSEPHSTKQIEDCVSWGRQIAPQTLVDTVAGKLGLDGARRSDIDQFCARVRCPMTIVHGTADEVRPPPVSVRLAELTGGSLVLLDGVGHGPLARHPVRINHLIRDFVERVRPTVTRSTWVAAPRRPRRVLFLSSPIGLGHARRDLAIAQELRALHPELHVDWLAQHPVTAVLEAAGQRVHPASAWLASESAHIEHEAGEHDLHAFEAIRRMDEILVHNFMIFDEVVTQDHYDLVVGDEAWDVDHHLHENPELKRFAFAWLTDFVGWLPMPDGGEREAALTADLNAEMIEQRARFGWVRDRSVFVGNPDDVVPDRFGPGLPLIADWVRENFDFAGYVTGFDATGVADRVALRARLGYCSDERVCLVTVGGSGVGEPLLRRVLDAAPLVRRQAPDLRFVVVAGPRIDPRSLPRRRGVQVRGHVLDLYQHLAASDVAVVQGGLTTTMELTANQRPFLYVPLRHHFEQSFHVRHRLERYGAGRRLDYEDAVEPDHLAEAILKEVDRDVAYRPVETDGARVAAAMLSELLG